RPSRRPSALGRAPSRRASPRPRSPCPCSPSCAWRTSGCPSLPVSSQPLRSTSRWLSGALRSPAKSCHVRPEYPSRGVDLARLDGEYLVDLEGSSARHIGMRLEDRDRRVRIRRLDDRIPTDLDFGLWLSRRDLADHLK